MKIEDLVGHEMSGLCYIRDYIELQFDGPAVRFFIRPKVTKNKKEVSDEAELHTVLKSLIGLKIASLNLHNDRFLEMKFEGDVQVSLSLVGHEQNHLEVMHFVRGARKPIDVW